MYCEVFPLICGVFIALTSHSALVSTASVGDTVDLDALRADTDRLLRELEKSMDDGKAMKRRIGALTRQMMLQQLFVEERLRSEGQSGIKQIRNGAGGTKMYYSSSHVGRAVAAIHDHSNNIRTVGMGEFIGVLNGVEFRTRHNDYRLYMPSTTSGQYHSTEDIPFPDVPPEVLAKVTVKEEIKEMVEWFKAWKNGDHSTRDYRKYFKPVLCYLEGTWTKNTKNIDEPFESDRHFVDASSWFDLQEKIRFTSYTGRKDNLENFAYLPTTIMEIINETTAVFAQWNYRIMCHPLKHPLPLNRLRMVDDIGSRMAWKKTMEEQKTTRAARFQVNVDDRATWKERSKQFGLLDKLMGEIPGKDNYPANLTDGAFGELAHTLDPEKSGQVLNVGYYHRWYKVVKKGAMGLQTRHRGFSDPNLFMAMNTQDRIAGMKINYCRGRGRGKKCYKYEQKWSYAIPLEIIYLTPLNKWNPYNLTYKGDAKSTAGKTVNANGRNGGFTANKAFDGLNSKTYYLTPNEFYAGTETNTDAADTTRGSVGVLDPARVVRKVRATGIRVFLPSIPGVGVLRQRYPIMPVHGEGSTTWKDLEAVEDLLMESKTYSRLFREKLASGGGDGGTTTPGQNTPTTLETGLSTNNKVPPHTHTVTMSPEEMEILKNGGRVNQTTTQVEGHQHDITVAWDGRRKKYYMALCGSTPDRTKLFQTKCLDRHKAFMTVA